MQKKWRKTTKTKWIGALNESYRERKVEKLFEKVSLKLSNQSFKKFCTRFSINRKIGSIDASINLVSIEHRSKQTKVDQSF